MDMESTRRSFDRSRELGMKKPRLTDELERGPNPSARPFPQRQAASGVAMLASARFRTNERDSESSESVRGYQPQQPGLHQELVTQYKTALAELTFNSKPIITNLTIIAGENLYAAKAIAATVCSNILEVPSEQKLPSLYLLDSIVKNIGRDYIKYFAARLPEVFCKAYRHVDPAVHSSMRHLFGTWKGVFPPHTLQMIEKELGFNPTVNGSSSAPSALKSDTQSQRPPHSIHVNPKYLERQRLQQSSQTKGIAKDMTGAITNSSGDSEMPVRGLTAGRPWAGPAVNMHSAQQSQRDASNDTVPEKGIGISYGGKGSGSELSRNLGLGVGRLSGTVSELEHHGQKAGSDIVETTCGQRNGFIINDATAIGSNVTSTSWKNSEEEEFMWEDMNSGLTDPVASKVSGNLSKDSWTADDETLMVEDHLHITHPFGTKVDRDASNKRKQPPAFRQRPSLSWQLQEESSIDELNRLPGLSGQSEGFAPIMSGLLTSANSSIVRTGNRPFLRNATVGNLHHPRNLAEQDRSKAPKTSPISGGLQSQYSQDSLPIIPPKVQVGNLQRSQQKDVQGPLSLPSVTSFQLEYHNALSQLQPPAASESEVPAKTEKQPEFEVSLAGEILEQSNTSSLSAAVMEGGILSNHSITSSLPNLNFLDKKTLPSKSGVQPSRAGASPPSTLALSGAGVTLPSSLGYSSNNDLSTPSKISQGKVGQPTRPSALLSASSIVSTASAAQTSNVTNNPSNPISNLLSSLVAQGLISANSESSIKLPAQIQTRLEDQSQSIATSTSSPVASDPGSAVNPTSSTGDEVDHPAKSTVALSQPTTMEIRNLVGFEFKPDVIRKLHPAVISELFKDFPHHCSICGLRLKYQGQFDRHLEWHATREREQNGIIRASRKWYAKSGSWIAGKAEFQAEYENSDSQDINGKEAESNEPYEMVQADENQCLCVLCGELFEEVYCQERDEWMFKGAIHMTISDTDDEMEIKDVGTVADPIVHAKCLSESSISSVIKTEQDQ